MDSALADSVFLDVTGRTAKRLLELAGDSDEFQLPITQEELAGMVGASRERVNKAIASFVRLGWIDQTDRRYASSTGSSSLAERTDRCARCRRYRVRKAIDATPGVGRILGPMDGPAASCTKPWSASS